MASRYIICVCILILSICFNYLIVNLYNDLSSLVEIGKCPSCYGLKMCPFVYSQKLQLEDWTQFKPLNFFNSKNVFYGSLFTEGLQKVVIKKLAHNYELDNFDQLICNNVQDQEPCNVSYAIKSLTRSTIENLNLKSHNLSLAIPNIVEYLKIESDIILCPSKRKYDDILKIAAQVEDNEINQISMIITMISLNQEPLILQFFNEENEKWYLPKYYGSCGRLICEEYIGKRLTEYYKEPFMTRAKIALQLLELAMLYTDNKINYSLYLTDVAPENFAVYDEGDGEVLVKLIDAENIILVDQMEPKENQILHVSSTTSCNDRRKQCFAFSSDDLCKYHKSDHNYFAICSVILSKESVTQEFPDGFLHTIPEEFNNHLTYFLDICRDPASDGFHTINNGIFKVNNRIEASQMLVKFLKNIIFNASFNN